MGGGINCKICRNKKYDDETEIKFNNENKEDELKIIPYNESPKNINQNTPQIINNQIEKNNKLKINEENLIKGKLNNEEKTKEGKKRNEFESVSSIDDKFGKIEIIEDQNLNLIKGIKNENNSNLIQNNLKHKKYNSNQDNGKNINIDSQNVSPIIPINYNEMSGFSKINHIYSETQEHSQLENSFIKNILNNQIEKIEFGLEDENQKKLNYEEKKIFDEAKKNLKQFSSIDKKDNKYIEKMLKKIPIGSLVPENKNIDEIIQKENAIIFHSELKKLINYEYYSRKPKMYSSKFCLLTPKFFKYYKSKEQFLRDLNPICTVPISQITRINLCKISNNNNNSNKNNFHIIICNKLALSKNDRNFLMGSLLDGLNNDNSYSPIFETNETLLNFTSDNNNSLLKWYFLMNFLIQKKNN